MRSVVLGPWSLAHSLLLPALLVVSALTSVIEPARADDNNLPSPTDEVILEVSGEIAKTNADGMAFLDLGMLEGLGLTTFSTESPWTDGMTRFEGPLLKDLVALVGGSGSKIRLTALDDYEVTIPLADADAYRVILATRRNGEHMQIRDKGPIWIIYPWSDHPEIQNEENYAKAIWQVFTIEFQK